MSRRTKDMVYRDPGYMGGLCAVCRKRMRDYQHPDYPSMCASCRASRLKPLDMPIPSLEDVRTARSAGLDVVLERSGITPADMEIGKQMARRMFEREAARMKDKDSIQNLNAELHPTIKRLLGKQETGR